MVLTITVPSYYNCDNIEALTSQGMKRKILVVDDEPDIALTLDRNRGIK